MLVEKIRRVVFEWPDCKFSTASQSWNQFTPETSGSGPTTPGIPLTAKIGFAPVSRSIRRRNPSLTFSVNDVRPPLPLRTGNQGSSTCHLLGSSFVLKKLLPGQDYATNGRNSSVGADHFFQGPNARIRSKRLALRRLQLARGRFAEEYSRALTMLQGSKSPACKASISSVYLYLRRILIVSLILCSNLQI